MSRSAPAGALALILMPAALLITALSAHAGAADDAAAAQLQAAEIENMVAALPDDDQAARELAERLAQLPDEAFPALASVARAACFDAPDTMRRRVIEATYREFGPAGMARFLTPLVGPEAPDADRVFALWYVRERGLRGGVELALDAATNASDTSRRSQLIRGALRSAVTAQSERERGALSVIGERFATLPRDVQRTLLDAVPDFAGSDATRWTGELLSPAGAHDDLVLSRLTSLPLVRPEPLNERARRRIVESLGDGRAAVRRGAAACVGRYHVVDAVPALIDLLEDDDAHVARVALRALQRMTTSRLGPLPDDWTEFVTHDATWLESESHQWLAQLNSAETTALSALQGLGRRRLFRHRIWQPIATIARTAPVAVRRAACRALGQLGEPAAIPSLVEVLKDDDPGVAATASRALAQVTGIAEPADPALWDDLLPASTR